VPTVYRMRMPAGVQALLDAFQVHAPKHAFEHRLPFGIAPGIAPGIARIRGESLPFGSFGYACISLRMRP
jgi:hypothetical protein